ncbi:CDC48 family AAA ATPase [Candidatus Micrarchaeota archaeon]|nr:CDC48 family AAA ATPase [Candidatus Micrarchaeota archaeon]
MDDKKTVYLRVAEALSSDVGKSIARLGTKVREQLGVSSGDVVKLEGKKTAFAIVWPSHPSDTAEGDVRINGILRQNSGVGLGDKVKVSATEAKEAKKIVLAPQQPVRFHAGFEQYVKKMLVGRPIVKGNVLPIGVFGTPIPLVVLSTLPSGPLMIAEETAIEIRTEPIKEMANVPSVTYDDVGGLGEEIQKIREMVELPLRHPELFEKLGIEPPKGVLMYGPPGTGKTLLAKAVANESDANFIYLGGPEVVSKYVGESEQRLRQLFDEAQKNAPSIIFIDEIDAIAPKREEVTGEVERRMVSQMLTLMDGLKSRGEVIVIAATNRQDSLDPALRRPGRFDREIEFGVPDRDGRKAILRIHTRNMPLEKNVKLEELAGLTHGYTGADISSLTKEAAIRALRRLLPKINLEDDEIPIEVLDNLKVKREDFFTAMRGITPSALREVFVEKPNVKWGDVGGLDSVKAELKELVDLPLQKPEVFEKMGIRPIRGILMYGPPGTGKTLLAKAVATESEANFIAINGPEIFSKWVGESEKVTREFFRKARQAAPCILFIDEIDAIAPVRGLDAGGGSLVSERVVDTILSEMDGLRAMKKVVVIAATNRPDMLDRALLRAGRFDRVVEIPLPSEEGREEIFKVHTKDMPLRGVDLGKLVAATKNYSGADIENLCREAGMMAIRAEKESVGEKEFDEALKKVGARVVKKDVESVKKFKDDFGEMYQ